MTVRIAAEGFADTSVSQDPARLARHAMRQATATLRDPSLVMLYLASARLRDGGHDALLKAAYEARVQAPGAVLVACETPGALSTSGEREGAAAVAVLAFEGTSVRASLGAIETTAPRETHAARVAGHLASGPDSGRPARLGIAMLAPETHTTESLTGLLAPGLPPVVGAGTSLVVSAAAHREPAPCGAALVTLATSLGVSIVASTATRRVSPWMSVDATEGPLVLRVDGERALDALSEHAEAGASRESMLVAVRGAEGMTPLVRTITGIDASRGAIAVGDILPRGAQIAFAVRDAGEARSDLHERLGGLSRNLHGGAAAAALVFTCAGRGARFFGRSDADSGALRTRFPAIPFAGMLSGFELAPWGEGARVHLYTAVCAVFHRLS